MQPIIAKRCLECHSQDKRKGGLSLATYGDALDGGRNGPAIRPGNSARSLLIHRVTGAVEPQMPKDEDPLTTAELALVRRWIDQGRACDRVIRTGAAAVGSATGVDSSRDSSGGVGDMGVAAGSTGRKAPGGAESIPARRCLGRGVCPPRLP